MTKQAKIKGARAMPTALVLGVLLLVAAAPCQDRPKNIAAVGPAHTWPVEVVDLAADLPVQQNGRIKPLSTLAAFALLRLSGKRTLHFKESGRRLTPTEWLLDCIFHPRVARQYEVFVIDDWAVLDTLRLPRPADGSRRGRYAFDYLYPARRRLHELFESCRVKKASQRTRIEQQIFVLWQNYREFNDMIGFLDFAVARFDAVDEPLLGGVFGARRDVRFSEVLAKSSKLVAAVGQAMRAAPHKDVAELPEAVAYAKLVRRVKELADAGRLLTYIPPRQDEEYPGYPFQEKGKTWLSPGMLTDLVLDHGRASEKVALLEPWERLVDARNDQAAFVKRFQTLHATIRRLAVARGEYWKVPMEVSFYKADYFYWALILFGFGFVCCALQWLWPGSKLLYRAAWALILTPLGLLTVGITIRCILMGRPPITNLYDTFNFITAAVVVVALIIEMINRKRVGQLTAALMGTIGLFAAMRFEALDSQDTMRTLPAVLDTNFWLATHVTTVNMGYAASMLAAGIGSIYLLAKLLGLRRDDRHFYANISRMTYGTICFGLVFSTVGTILGGVWANDSWGRFWGWDPKENGALMIVLAQLAILHARNGGYLREFGICLVTPLLGVVVLFSWFHVNLLGVGLHTYGFSGALKTAVWIAYSIMALLFALGVVAWFRSRTVASALPPA